MPFVPTRFVATLLFVAALLVAPSVFAVAPSGVVAGRAPPVSGAPVRQETPRPLRVVVEVSERAGAIVDARVTRRLVALELGDVEVEPPHDAKTRSRSESVYFRVLLGTANVLVVELWSRGELAGKRRVSTEGGARLRARRIALVSAELARALQRRRRADEKRALARAARDAEARTPQGDLVLHGFFRTRANALGVAVGGGELALGGPALSLGVQSVSGPGLDIRFEWLAGKTRHIGGGDEASLLWYGAGIRPYFSWFLREDRPVPGRGPRTELELGGSLAFAGVRAVNVPAASDPERVLHEWTARALLDASVHLPLAPELNVGLGIEAGALLHPLRFRTATGSDEFGALWFGASLQLSATSAKR